MSNIERIAFIREAECIGCTKCIQACPVDAIIGAAQLMHTVVKALCIGCDLCVPPCPVDCIDMLEIDDPSTKQQQKEKAKLAKQRFQSRKVRLAKIETQKEAERKKRIAEFKASPQANELIKRAIEKATAARSGRTDAERVAAARTKLESKLTQMKEELALARADNTSNNNQTIQELENRINVWKLKLMDSDSE